MTHETCTAKLDLYLDGELDGAAMQELDAHLRECAPCAAEGLRRQQWKRAVRAAGLQHLPDPAVRERIRRNSVTRTGSRIWRWWPALTVPALALLLLGAAFIVQHSARRARNGQIMSELADLHVATLASATPVDVAASDRHTVKPWFEGKIPFSFSLPELQATGFELVGGRVSYLEQSPGAELIFRLRKHQISAFIFQDRALPRDLAVAQSTSARSFHVETWKQDGLRYFLIGDTAPEDLRALGELLKNAK